MQSGNADEMRDPGAIEHGPLGLRNGALVADRKRNDHTRVPCIGKRAIDAFANAFARPLDVVAPATGKHILPDVGGIAADVASRAEALLQQPRFEVEAAGIDVAMRPLEAHGERPALAGADGGDRVVRILVPVLRVPRKRQARRHDRARRQHPLDRERKASTPGAAAGRSSMMPTSRMSSPSHSTGSASASRASARHAA